MTCLTSQRFEDSFWPAIENKQNKFDVWRVGIVEECKRRREIWLEILISQQQEPTVRTITAENEGVELVPDGEDHFCEREAMIAEDVLSI